MVHCLSLISIGLLLTLTQALPIQQTNQLLNKRGGDDGSASIHTYCARPKEIALTFDDGPGDYTESLINYLKGEGVTATFFINGDNYWGDDSERINPVLSKAYDGGFEIGSHTYTHLDISTLNKQQLTYQISKNEQTIYNAIKRYPAVIRPPYGGMNNANAKQLKDWGYTIVNWDIDISDSLDNENPSVDDEMKEVLEKLEDNSRGHIILSHDVKEQTAEGFARRVTKLKDQGYKFVTVSDCLGVPAYKSSGISGGSKSDTNSEVDTQSEPTDEKETNDTLDMEPSGIDDVSTQDTEPSGVDTTDVDSASVDPAGAEN